MLDADRFRLQRTGFSLAETSGYRVMVFPDGADAWIERRGSAAVEVDVLLRLAGLRSRALAALRALLAQAGWRVRREDRSSLQLVHGAGRCAVLQLGHALTFWLQREPLAAAVQRFGAGLLERRPSARQVRRAERSALRLPHATLASPPVAVPLPDLEIESGPGAGAALLPILVDALLQGVLQRARAGLMRGVGLQLGASRLWAADGDGWATRAEWLAWAALPRSLQLDGSEQVGLRHAAALHQGWVRARLLATLRGELPAAESAVAAAAVHFLDEDAIAARVLGPDLQAQPAQFAAAGQLHALYPAWTALQRLVQGRPWHGEGLADLLELGELCAQLDAEVAALLTPAQCSTLQRRAQALLLAPPAQAGLRSRAALALTRLALALQWRPLAAQLLALPGWQDALLRRAPDSRYLVLQDAVLALALLAPDGDCRELIARACGRLDIGREPQPAAGIELALAIAWSRCVGAEVPRRGVAPATLEFDEPLYALAAG